MNNSIQTYSSALVQPAHKYPNKEQAIIFNAIDGARIQDYLLQLGPIVNPKNILFCSRISNNRLCVYLSSKAWVDKFLADPGEIVIQGEKVRARRLVTPSDRLVISNVCPTIPNTAIKSALEQLDLQLSPISFLRIDATLPEYSHILSFRRVTYVAPNESTKIPESIEINHEGLKYRIFLSLDSQKCFKCKQGDILPHNVRPQYYSPPYQQKKIVLHPHLQLKEPHHLRKKPRHLQKKPHHL
nr:unnamed protein product [Callosobruchus chinensis]